MPTRATRHRSSGGALPSPLGRKALPGRGIVAPTSAAGTEGARDVSKTMRVQPFELLLRRALRELKACDSIFGLPRPLFYVPKRRSLYATESLFGEYLATPIGPAAGPHTQLAQNIVSAWLSGGRFIELKTVQIMDTLEIPRPCIDMEDEGYNVEWSQELRLDESADEYVKAWALVQVLHRLLGFEKKDRAWGRSST